MPNGVASFNRKGQPAMDFWSALVSCIRKYASFGGRAPRAEYWYFVLFSTVSALAIGVIDAAFMPPLTDFGAMVEQGRAAELHPLGTAWNILLFLPSLAVLVRRLHDTNRRAWVLAWPFAFALVAVAGGIAAALGSGTPMGKFTAENGQLVTAGGVALLVAGLGLVIWGILCLIWLCRRGTAGENRFGPDPLAH